MICGYDALGCHGDVDPVADLSGGNQDKPWDRSWDLGRTDLEDLGLSWSHRNRGKCCTSILTR